MSMSFQGLTLCVKTFGCQMNKHDSERVLGTLEALGATPVDSFEEADMVVFLTCCVREAADTRLYGQVATMRTLPLRPDSPLAKRLIAIGGCIGQRDGRKLVDAMPHVDVVFGTHNLHALPSLLQAALDTGSSQVEVRDASASFPTDLPTDREQPWAAWLPITIGCNNFCSYCIVPYVRGREKSRPLEDIVSEAEGYVAEGVKEITLLGQNVNSYGRDLYGSPRFVDVLDAVALHRPGPSGSDRILKAMNRRYDAARYLDLVRKLREAKGDIALSTDIIVGFPGETEEDFMDTYRLVEAVGYHQVFTFIYSKREGTPAASMPDDTPREVIQGRFDRLVELVQRQAFEANQTERGRVVPVLVEGASKRDSSLLSGRSPKNQTVHAPVPAGCSAADLQGRIVDVRIDDAKTWYLQGSLA